jgi:FtsP/CotA-like multicopper oxidase with cupredoxin domain
VSSLLLAAALTVAAASGGRVESAVPQRPDQALRDPPVVASRNGVLRLTLRMAPGEAEVGGRRFRAELFNGRYVPPTLRAHPGDLIRLRVENRLAEPTNFHFHGFNVSSVGNSDNVFLDVRPGTDRELLVRIPRDHPSGTYWYHPHYHPLVEDQVFSGLSGVIVVEGLEQRVPALRGLRQRILALKDVQIGAGGRLPANINSDAPTTRTVNGQLRPRIPIRPGETQLWRIANVGADIWYRVRLDGQDMVQIGEDGNPYARPVARREIVLPPGKRADVLVRGLRTGSYRLRTLRYVQGVQGDTYPERLLATMVVAGAPEAPRPLPTRLLPFRDLSRAHIARRRRLVFSENPAGTQFFINGRQFSHTRIDQRVRRGTVEEWRIINVSGEEHPFHIHQGDFQVMSVNGRAARAPGLQDVVPLPSHGSVTIRMRFDDPRRFVYHCHILAHEDAGMMGTVLVTA